MRDVYHAPLRRHPTRGLLGGVCAGLAEYWEVDQAFVRIGAIVAGVFLTQFTVVAYAVAWLVLDD